MERVDVYRLKSDKNSYVFFGTGITYWARPEAEKELTTPYGDATYIKSITLYPNSIINGIDTNTIIKDIKEHGSHFKKIEPKSTVSQGGAAIGGGILGGSLFGPAGALIGAIAGLAIAEHHSRTIKNEF